MKEEIKEKLLREIEDNLISENRTYDERDIKKAIEETSKEKDEEKKEFGKYQFNLGVELQKAYDKQEFIKILTKLEDDMDALQINYANLDECKKVDVYELIEEIKQKGE